jgi:type I restriction enzyme R subunit
LKVFAAPLIALIDGIRREKEQTIDHNDLDAVLRAEWEGDAAEDAKALAADFENYLLAYRIPYSV